MVPSLDEYERWGSFLDPHPDIFLYLPRPKYWHLLQFCLHQAPIQRLDLLLLCLVLSRSVLFRYSVLGHSLTSQVFYRSAQGDLHGHIFQKPLCVSSCVSHWILQIHCFIWIGHCFFPQVYEAWEMVINLQYGTSEQSIDINILDYRWIPSGREFWSNTQIIGFRGGDTDSFHLLFFR